MLSFISDRKLAGKTLFITGASRGIGKAIALKAAKDGANIVIAAKTTEPHPKLPGTIYTAAKEGKLIRRTDLVSTHLIYFSLEGRYRSRDFVQILRDIVNSVA